MGLRVKLFAESAEVAGEREVSVQPGSVDEATDQLVDRFGEEMRRVLSTSQLWLNGVASDVSGVEGVVLLDGDEIAVIPPVSGG